MVRWWL